jgi:tetratricopeptide (TPR) repeat protein
MTSWSEALQQLAARSPEERRAVLRGWLRSDARAAGVPASAGSEAGDYERIFASLPHRLQGECERIAAERENAPAALARLLGLTPDQRREAVRRNQEFQTWAMARLLGAASLRKVGDDPASAVELASLALETASAAPRLTPALRADLQTLCYSYLANAQRAASMFNEAWSSFQRAEECFERSPRDPGRAGFLKAMLADFFADRSEFDRSLKCARNARRAFRAVGDTLSATRASIQESTALYYLGKTDEAARLLEAAMPVAESANEPRLLFIMLASRAAYLVESEQFEDAGTAVQRARSLLPQVPGKLDRARLVWIEAEIDSASGNLQAAEHRFRAVRDVFSSTGSLHEVAIVTLELALVLARSGRFAEAKEAAREAIPVLQSLGIAPEAILAVRVYVESSLAEAAQVSALGSLVRRLKRWTPPPGS